VTSKLAAIGWWQHLVRSRMRTSAGHLNALGSRSLKMEAKIAGLLNASSSDKQKLNELISEYLSESFENSDSEIEDDDEAFGDDDDAEVNNVMTSTDCEIALQHASTTRDTLSLSEEDELQKALQFR